MRGNDEIEQENEWRRDPSNWIWGIFYFNRKDKRLLVPKRVEWMGFTVNMANPLAYLVMLAIILWIVFLGTLPVISRYLNNFSNG